MVEVLPQSSLDIEAPVLQLPTEILSHVLDFVDTKKDQQATRLVCKDFSSKFYTGLVLSYKADMDLSRFRSCKFTEFPVTHVNELHFSCRVFCMIIRRGDKIPSLDNLQIMKELELIRTQIVDGGAPIIRNTIRKRCLERTTFNQCTRTLFEKGYIKGCSLEDVFDENITRAIFDPDRVPDPAHLLKILPNLRSVYIRSQNLMENVVTLSPEFFKILASHTDWKHLELPLNPEQVTCCLKTMPDLRSLGCYRQVSMKEISDRGVTPVYLGNFPTASQISSSISQLSTRRYTGMLIRHEHPTTTNDDIPTGITHSIHGDTDTVFQTSTCPLPAVDTNTPPPRAPHQHRHGVQPRMGQRQDFSTSSRPLREEDLLGTTATRERQLARRYNGRR